MSDAAPENKPSESAPTAADAASNGAPPAVNWVGSSAPAAAPTAAPAPRAVVTARPMRRPSNTAARKPSSESQNTKVPAPPSKAKSVAMLVCGLLLVACVGMGGYLIYRKTTGEAKGSKTALEKLSPEARRLAEKADAAAKIYEDGKAKATSDNLEDLAVAEAKFTEASALFNEVADANQTVEGFKDTIEFARNKKLSIDKELRQVRTKKDDLEMRALREKSKANQANKPADPAPASSIPGKEPTEEELSDKNLDKLFENDPSEYERLAKIKEKRDPNFKMKKP